MTFRELQDQWPDLLAHAIIESDVQADSEVAVIDDSSTQTQTTAPPSTATPEDKDKRIAELEGQLNEMNKVLGEQARRKDQGDNDGDRSTNIYIGIDGAKAGRRGGTNPLTMAFLRRKKKQNR